MGNWIRPVSFRYFSRVLKSYSDTDYRLLVYFPGSYVGIFWFRSPEIWREKSNFRLRKNSIPLSGYLTNVQILVVYGISPYAKFSTGKKIRFVFSPLFIAVVKIFHVREISM